MDLPPPPHPGRLPFRDPAQSLADIGPEATARILSAAGDVTLVLDPGGVIRDVAVGSSDLGEDPFSTWIDRPFVDTVSPDSRRKVEEMLQDAASRTAPRWRQVNHPAGDSHLPVRYLALEARSDGRVIAVGRDMREAAALQRRLLAAQQSMERDYLRMREAEQRYRLLFDLLPDPLLIIDPSSRRVTEANAAAEALSGGRRGGLSGRAVTTLFGASAHNGLVALVGAAASGATPSPLEAALASGGDVLVSATPFRQDRTQLVLLRLEPKTGAPAGVPLLAILERLPDAFVLTDRHGSLLAVNQGFLDLTGLPRAEQAVGTPFARWFARPDIDHDLLLSQLKTSGEVRNFETQLRTRLGEPEDVEISAVSADIEGETRLGFVIRGIARRFDRAAPGAGARSVEQLTELVGRVSLKDIVRESTDLIERLCIEAALRYTSNNRASAAEILGLSRQSLYSKLHRHGLGPAFDPGDGRDDGPQ
ncbi:MAG: transcriptional regulator PpsR [Sphingomonadaceae bacterium]